MWVACAAINVLGSLIKPLCLYPGATWTLALPIILIAPTNAMLGVIMGSQFIDVTEWDELHTGERREVTILMVSGWIGKVAGSMVIALSAYLLVFCGFEAANGINHSPAVFEVMLWCYTLLPVVLMSIAYIFIRRFPITAAMAVEIRTKLDARNETSRIQIS